MITSYPQIVSDVNNFVGFLHSQIRRPISFNPLDNGTEKERIYHRLINNLQGLQKVIVTSLEILFH